MQVKFDVFYFYSVKHDVIILYADTLKKSTTIIFHISTGT